MQLIQLLLVDNKQEDKLEDNLGLNLLEVNLLVNHSPLPPLLLVVLALALEVQLQLLQLQEPQDQLHQQPQRDQQLQLALVEIAVQPEANNPHLAWLEPALSSVSNVK